MYREYEIMHLDKVVALISVKTGYNRELPYHLYHVYGYEKEKEMFLKRLQILDNY